MAKMITFINPMVSLLLLKLHDGKAPDGTWVPSAKSAAQAIMCAVN